MTSIGTPDQIGHREPKEALRLMEQYGIAYIDGQFHFDKYRYDFLSDAIEYARRHPEKTGKKQDPADGIKFTVIGGSGWRLFLDMELFLVMTTNGIDLIPKSSAEPILIPFEDLTALQISGPGSQKTNAGFVGGGVGAEGAAIGILAAGLLNTLTTKSSTNTFLRIATREEEAFLHSSTIEPFALRMQLSPAVIRMEASLLDITSRRSSMASEIRQLSELKNEGVLTQEEFERAKFKLLS